MNSSHSACNFPSTRGSVRKYPLQHVEQPNLFRDIFPSGQMPRLVLDGGVYRPEHVEDIRITDTTFRDGQQSLPPFKTEHIVRLYELMHLLDGGTGLIRQSEFFLYTKKDRLAIEQCLALGYDFPEVIGWIRATESDFKLVPGLGLSEIGILTSISDYQTFLKLGWNRQQAVDNYLRIVRMTLEHGIIPCCNIEDTTRADIYGVVVPFAIELMKLSSEYGLPVKIRICDTLGFGVDIADAALPRSVQGIVYALRHDAGVPADWLEWHGHNDFYRSVSNGTTAWLHGCSAVNGTWLGIGERTGNTPNEAMVMEYLALRGTSLVPGLDTTMITQIAHFMQHEMGLDVPARQPFVGPNFNVTKAGIHADGMLKHPEIYNPFDTDLILNRPAKVCITDKSGVAGIAFWVNTYFNLPKDRWLPKDHPAIRSIKLSVDELYDGGRISAISNEEMIDLVHRHVPVDFINSNSVPVLT